MCEVQRNTMEYGLAEEFLAEVDDFLVPIHADKVFCQLGICPNTDHDCWPELWQCKYSENMVRISGLEDDGIRAARLECMANNTCNIEPVGGEGGLIETPQRDDFLPQDIVNRECGRDARVESLKQLRLVLIVNCAIVIILLATYGKFS